MLRRSLYYSVCEAPEGPGGWYIIIVMLKSSLYGCARISSVGFYGATVNPKVQINS